MLDNLTLADLQIIWFILVGVLFSGYAILDGFDLGTGALQLFIKGDENRRLTLNAVGPVWDGNEVWLYETVGGKHSWKETGVDTGEELWKFFSRYVR